MSRTIQFSVTEAEHEIISKEAAVKGLSPSAFAKTATAGHIQKYGRPESKMAWDDAKAHIDDKQAV